MNAEWYWCEITEDERDEALESIQESTNKFVEEIDKLTNSKIKLAFNGVGCSTC